MGLTNSDKWCVGCQLRHPRSAFYANRAAPSGLQSSCKDAQLRYRQANRHRAAAYHVRVKYGMTLSCAEELRRGPCCACGALDPGTASGFHIDHCHTTGCVRGALCHGCNLSAGLLRDSPERCEQLAAYLRLHGR